MFCGILKWEGLYKNDLESILLSYSLCSKSFGYAFFFRIFYTENAHKMGQAPNPNFFLKSKFHLN